MKNKMRTENIDDNKNDLGKKRAIYEENSTIYMFHTYGLCATCVLAAG
jgi:hypothetical protein